MRMFWTVLMLLGLVSPAAFSAAVCQAADAAPGGTQGIAWPLRASRSGRYVTDNKGVPHASLRTGY